MHLAADTEPWTDVIALHLFHDDALAAAARSEAWPRPGRMSEALHTLRSHPAVLSGIFRAAVDAMGLSQERLFSIVGPDFTPFALQSQLLDTPDGEAVFRTTWPVLELLAARHSWPELGMFHYLRILRDPPPAELQTAAVALSHCSALLGVALDAEAGATAGLAVFLGVRCGARSRCSFRVLADRRFFSQFFRALGVLRLCSRARLVPVCFHRVSPASRNILPFC